MPLTTIENEPPPARGATRGRRQHREPRRARTRRLGADPAPHRGGRDRGAQFFAVRLLRAGAVVEPTRRRALRVRRSHLRAEAEHTRGLRDPRRRAEAPVAHDRRGAGAARARVRLLRLQGRQLPVPLRRRARLRARRRHAAHHARSHLARAGADARRRRLPPVLPPDAARRRGAGRDPCDRAARVARAGADPIPAEPIAPIQDFSHGRPLGDQDFDTCFAGWDGRATISWPGSGVRAHVGVRLDAGPHDPVRTAGQAVLRARAGEQREQRLQPRGARRPRLRRARARPRRPRCVQSFA